MMMEIGLDGMVYVPKQRANLGIEEEKLHEE